MRLTVTPTPPPPPPPPSLLLLLLLLLLSLVSFAPAQPAPLTATISAATATAYDVLQSHGLPKGLLPSNIQAFTVNATTGFFQATIAAPCTATFQTDLHYNRTISGLLSYGQIASLSGLLAHELFLWFPVLAIRLDANTSGVICFDVGVVYKRYPLSLFEFPPLCTPDSSPSLSTFAVADTKHVSTL